VPTTRSRILIFWLALLGLALGSGVRDVWTIDPDAAAYVSLGRSLAAGDGYQLAGVPHGKYPPGLPSLVAGLSLMRGPEAYAAFHLALVALLLAAVACSAALARRLGYGPLVALVLALCVGMSQTLFDLSLRYLRTEVPFLALSLAAMLLADRALRPGGRPRHALASALCMGLAMATRLAGVTLLVVPALHLARPRDPEGGRRRAALMLVLGLVFPLAWGLRGQQLRSDQPLAPDYSAELLAAAPRDLTKTVPEDLPRVDAAGLARRVAGNLTVFARASAVLLTNVDKAGEILLAGAALALTVLLGLLAMLRAGAARRDAAVYVLATLALYLVWPFNQQERFYAPLLPWLLLAAGEGLDQLWSRARVFSLKPGGRAALVLALLGATLTLAARHSHNPTVLGRWSPSYTAALAGLAGATLLSALWLRRQALPALPSRAALLLVPLLFAGPFLKQRLVAWPEQVAAHTAYRAQNPASGSLARIDVNPLLEQIARHLATHAAPDAVLMTDVPKIMEVIAGRRCVPFHYRSQPPEVLTDDADYLFYTGEFPELAQIMDVCASRFDVELELAPVFDGVRSVTPVLYAVRR